MSWYHSSLGSRDTSTKSISLSLGIELWSQYQSWNRNFSFLGLSISLGTEKLLPLVSVSASVSEKLVSPTSVGQLLPILP